MAKPPRFVEVSLRLQGDASPRSDLMELKQVEPAVLRVAMVHNGIKRDFVEAVEGADHQKSGYHIKALRLALYLRAKSFIS